MEKEDCRFRDPGFAAVTVENDPFGRDVFEFAADAGFGAVVHAAEGRNWTGCGRAEGVATKLDGDLFAEGRIGVRVEFGFDGASATGHEKDQNHSESADKRDQSSFH